VQIDHTQLDIELVDRNGRRMGRAWFTAVIDEYSRALLGFYISPLPPQRFVVGMALAHAIYPKGEWLVAHGVEGAWEMSGVPFTISSDSGSDLRANDTKDAHKAIGITNVDFRPRGRPKYGAIIERFMGTMAQLAKGLPGYTGPHWLKKPKPSQKLPCFTLDEINEYITRWVVTRYHQRSVGRRPPPARSWCEAAERMPVTMCKKPLETREYLEKLYLPSTKPKTVGSKGVQHLYLFFRSEYLDRFLVNASKESRQVEFRVDPRSISQIYYQDKQAKEFVPIPLDEPDFDLPAMSWNAYDRDWKALVSAKERLDPEGEKRGRIANRSLIAMAQTRERQRNRVQGRRDAEVQRRYADEQDTKNASPNNDNQLPDLKDDGAWAMIDVVPNLQVYS
jgi:putative transposase